MAKYWYCVKHHRVEQGEDGCPPIDRLGPYATAEEAEHALEKAEERNQEWDNDPALERRLAQLTGLSVNLPGRAGRSRNATSPWPFVGMAGWPAAFFLYAASGLVAPVVGVVAAAAGLAGAVRARLPLVDTAPQPAARWWRSVAVVLWFAVLTAGGAWLGWTAADRFSRADPQHASLPPPLSVVTSRSPFGTLVTERSRPNCAAPAGCATRRRCPLASSSGTHRSAFSAPTASAPSRAPHCAPCTNVPPVVASVGTPERHGAATAPGSGWSVIGTHSL